MTSTVVGPSQPPTPSVLSLSVASRPLCVAVRLYQAARAGRPSSCRYWPTCSNYALEALAAHGAAGGSWLTTRRLLRCHPWASRSGVDLVPPGRRPTSSSGFMS